MKSKFLFVLSVFAVLTARAQTDVTKYYLSNYGFDSDFHYTADSQDAVAQEIRTIDGWTPTFTIDYTITGIYEFGFGGTFNNGTVPSVGYDGEAGGALALSTGWDQTFCYYQSVTLPAGTYTVKVPTYNGKTVTGGTSQLSWIPNSGTSTTSTLTSYPAKAWTLDQITFTLTATTTGKIQIGYKAASGGSVNSANLVIDYVQLLGQDMAVDKTTLYATLQTANTFYGTGTGNGASDLQSAISAAQAVYDNSSATMPEVLEADYVLTQAIDTYNRLNASEDNPVDYTSYIVNPSFEQDATTGWTVQGMQRQSNSVFTLKAGTYYLESWVGIGSQLGNHGVSQTLRNLPEGNYRLSVAALHIQQSGSGSITNSGADQTGVYLFAGSARQAVTSLNTYSLSFAVIDDGSDIEIGLVAENATGNYLCVDNFRLEYIGGLSTDSYRTELQNLLEQAQELLDLGMQNSVATTLQSAMTTAQNALSSTNQSTLSSALATLTAALEEAKASRALYDTLLARLEYAQQVSDWWEGESYRATAWSQLQTAIATATTQSTNNDLTTAQLTSAITTLNTAISAVDKSIYCSGNACGSDSELQNSDSYWSYERSIQSKHWILFWEKGYGTTVPSAVPGILEKADQLFDFYANDLGYITINQGTSKTDTYKMIIRLRYTTDWEASGSGIDNTIGLLTLSNGAHTSRSGQTVAHEIGHCFQYQTHCDNGDSNGWMYNWGSSTLNVFWEMCAQWQAYKFYPTMQFVWDSNQGNDWFGGTINGLHRHPLCVDLRYNNYFIQDYMCHKQGDQTFLGRMWNESKSPEDPLQAYMRLTMTGTTAQKLTQLGTEMWEYGARMTTFDMDAIRSYGSSRIGFRSQTAMTLDSDSYWWPDSANCIENFGNNAIRLNVPSTAKTVYVDFEGKAGADGYNAYNTSYAGWRVGFVALKRDGTRVYGDATTATSSSPNKTVSFDCPSNVQYLWLVVSGAPTSYWTRDWLSWSEESTVEQWPYRVKFHQTNLYGYTTNNTYPDGSGNTTDPEEPEEVDQNPAAGQTTFDVTTAMAPWLSTVSLGEYTNDGFNVGTWGSYTGTDGSSLTAPFVEKWVSSGNNLPDASVQQTISELPNGTYYIGGSFIATSQNLNQDNIGGVTFWAQDKSIALATEDGAPELYSLCVEVTDGTLTFGVTTDVTNANWVAMDNLFLLWAGDEASYYAQATDASPVRVPISNPRMEDGLSGWTLSGTWQTQTTAFDNFDPTFMEAWTGSNTQLTDRSAMQLVNLNAGRYRLAASVLATQQGDETLTVEGVTLRLGTASVPCHTANQAPEVFTTETLTLEGGNTALGLYVASTTANWAAWDNVVLYCYGAQQEDAYWRVLRSCQAAQTDYEPNGFGAATSALAQYEWTETEYAAKTADEIDAAIAVLSNATLMANAEQTATSLLTNADFRGSTSWLDVQGSGGQVGYPAGWTFIRDYEGWNDTYVDATTGIFNAWAGTIHQAELYQTLLSLPNGYYRLSASVRVDREAAESETALYGTSAGQTVRSATAGSDLAGSTTDFLTYYVTFPVTDNTATVGLRSLLSFFQLKDVQLRFVRPGDITRDGRTNLSDLNALVDIVLGRDTSAHDYDRQAADAYENLHIGTADLPTLLRILMDE